MSRQILGRIRNFQASSFPIRARRSIWTKNFAFTGKLAGNVLTSTFHRNRNRRPSSLSVGIIPQRALCIKTRKQETPISGGVTTKQEPFVIFEPLSIAFSSSPWLYTFLSLSQPPGLAPTPTGQRAPIDLITRPFSRLPDRTHPTNQSLRNAFLHLRSAPLVYPGLFSFSYRAVRSLISHRTWPRFVVHWTQPRTEGNLTVASNLSLTNEF